LAVSGAASVVLEVIDDGVGFEPADPVNRDALGLVSMQERVRVVGGELAVSSRPGNGTRLKAVIPIESAPAVR
jgi:signal transduction histidine kinase